MLKKYKNRTSFTEPQTSSVIEETVSSNVSIDVIEELQKIRSNVSFYPIIKELSAKPFHIIYWSPEQMDLLKKVKKKYKFRLNLGILGIMIENVQIYSHESDSLNYFLFFNVINGVIFPFVQIISERKTEQFVKYCISEVLKKISVPHFFCTIPSMLLLEAASFSFNLCSLEEYCMQCA